jgi:hypothetical protein
MDRTENVVLDIEGLPQQPDKCCTGSPRMTVCPLFHKINMNTVVFLSLKLPYVLLQRALSRKGPNRAERRSGEEPELEDLTKKLIIKGFKLLLPPIGNKCWQFCTSLVQSLY